jgi:hypothetical protein
LIVDEISGKCEIIGVFGPMASGKTYLINQILERGNRYVRFDATGETCDDPGVEHIWQSPAELYRRICARPYYFRIAYHPGEEIEEDFRWCLKVLWKRKEIYKTLACDEFHEVCSVNETPKYVKTMLRYARHAHLGMIGASQRLADVHKLFTAGCRLVVLYRSDEARDIIAVKDRWGSEAADVFCNLRPLIHNDVTHVTEQVPQCLVIARGKKFRVYDFKVNGYVMGDGASNPSPESEDAREGEDDNQLPDASDTDIPENGANGGGGDGLRGDI